MAREGLPEWNITEAADMKVPKGSPSLTLDENSETGNLSTKTTLSTEVVPSSPIPYPDNLSDTTSIAFPTVPTREKSMITKPCPLCKFSFVSDKIKEIGKLDFIESKIPFYKV